MGRSGRGGVGGLILGIESSCDETAAAVVRGGREVLASVVASQMTLHAEYGGVVPELASREHVRNIVPVVREAMRRAAEREPGLTLADLDAVAVTEGPGLAGALLVGITYAKALAAGLEKPLIGVNHLEGHIHAVLMEGRTEMESEPTLSAPATDAMRSRELPSADRMGHPDLGPLMALVVSGGHTHLYLAEKGNPPFREKGERMGHPESSEYAPIWRYRNVGRTVDDAAGEAFDKVAKLLGLGYPGGPWMDALAKLGNPRAVEFRFQGIRRQKQMRGSLGSAAKAAPLGMTASSMEFDPTHDGEAVVNGAHETITKDKRRFPSRMTNNLSAGMTNKNIEQHFDFSFSGIKTAVLRYVQTHGMKERVEARRARLGAALKERPGLRASEAVREMPEVFDQQTLDLIASFQAAVVGNLLKQTAAAAEYYGARGVIVSGGVAANSELRRRFTDEAARRGMRVEFPALAMATDNAAMIAAAAWGKFAAGEFAGDEMRAQPGLRLG